MATQTWQVPRTLRRLELAVSARTWCRQASPRLSGPRLWKCSSRAATVSTHAAIAQHRRTAVFSRQSRRTVPVRNALQPRNDTYITVVRTVTTLGTLTCSPASESRGSAEPGTADGTWGYPCCTQRRGRNQTAHNNTPDQLSRHFSRFVRIIACHRSQVLGRLGGDPAQRGERPREGLSLNPLVDVLDLGEGERVTREVDTLVVELAGAEEGEGSDFADVLARADAGSATGDWWWYLAN